MAMLAMKTLSAFSRRNFLKRSMLGSVAAMVAPSWVSSSASEASSPTPTSYVSLTAGGDRADLVFRGLKSCQSELARAIGDRPVIIKPNNVSIDRPLCATHVETLEGILEFLKSIGRSEGITIAESAANGPTMEGFANYGYTRPAEKYRVRLMDLDRAPLEIIHVFDEKDFRPHPVRTAKPLLDRNNFIISAARMKTHDRVVATLSLKNIVFGAPIKDEGFAWGRQRRPGSKTDKPIVHGSGFRAINYNLFALAKQLRPDLAVIDGFEGMEGNGPVGGTAVDHRVCLVSRDWLAADRVAVELMGLDFRTVGYLNYCAQARMGEGDLERIQIVGEPIAKHIRKYKLHDNVEKQLIWMQPPQNA